jgi:soluble lytic murein transglycosylase
MSLRLRGIFGTILVLFSLTLNARTLDYATVHAMPESVEKDYYLWRYISSKQCTATEAKKLIREAKRINTKLAKAYRTKTGHLPPRRTNPKPARTAAQKREAKHKHARTLALLKHPDLPRVWRKLDTPMQVYVYNHAGTQGRKRIDQPLGARDFARLSTQYGFNESIRRILRERPKHFTQALLHLPAKTHRLTDTTLLQLGFFALEHGKKRIAETYFVLAADRARQRDTADKALFWAYLSRKNTRYLRQLTRSYDLNLYTLLARDILHLKYPATITPTLPKARLASTEKLYDPIHWAKLKQKIFGKKTNLKALASHYKSEEAIGYYTYIMAKSSRETAHYFPMPYRDVLRSMPKKRQALLYAIARQESRFVPASISTSYALGMMQIMPFLVRHLAKELGESVDYDAMFDPRTALRYANKHLDYLTRWLQHPLFVAYAYNAGIGYTRRMLRSHRRLFRGKGSYEPYLSLERVDNDQARHYGKRVLVNYVIYLNKLGVPTRISDLLATLHRPEKTDKFRSKRR